MLRKANLMFLNLLMLSLILSCDDDSVSSEVPLEEGDIRISMTNSDGSSVDVSTVSVYYDTLMLPANEVIELEKPADPSNYAYILPNPVTDHISIGVTVDEPGKCIFSFKSIIGKSVDYEYITDSVMAGDSNWNLTFYPSEDSEQEVFERGSLIEYDIEMSGQSLKNGLLYYKQDPGDSDNYIPFFKIDDVAIINGSFDIASDQPLFGKGMTLVDAAGNIRGRVHFSSALRLEIDTGEEVKSVSLEIREGIDTYNVQFP